MPMLAEEKRAIITVAIDREISKQRTILHTLYKELQKYAEANHGVFGLTECGYGISLYKEKSSLPKPILRTYQNYGFINTIASNYSFSSSGGNSNNIEFFVSVDKAIEQIKNDRTGTEMVVDFLKSIANQIIYLLSFTTHPGFFQTTTQPCQDIKLARRKAIELRNELVGLEKLDVQPVPSRGVAA